MFVVDLLAHWMVRRHLPLAWKGARWRWWFVAFWVALVAYSATKWTPLAVAACVCLLAGIVARRASRLWVEKFLAEQEPVVLPWEKRP